MSATDGPTNEKSREIQSKLDRSVIAVPLLEEMQQHPSKILKVIIDLNYHYQGGPEEAKRKVRKIVEYLQSDSKGSRQPDSDAAHGELTSGHQPTQYLFGHFNAAEIRELARIDRMKVVEDDLWQGLSNCSPKDISRKAFVTPAIHRIWLDFKVSAHLERSIRTVKCDAAHAAFGAHGDGIVWAVMDSGIDAKHPHFAKHNNLEDLPPALAHKDFTGEDAPLEDGSGHGTHVAGIVAGEAESTPEQPLYAVRRERDVSGEITYGSHQLPIIRGMAPRCKLLSLKVLDEHNSGHASNLISALDYVQELNGYGRHIQIHGVNMSVGYEFDPDWFACGQSPLCREVDRLVRTGVVVVTAAGNTGYGYIDSKALGVKSSGLALTINDPGNAALAITVGATHRDAPHVYGVSYFSSKGPTGDGRMKPDLVAPGERILSCASGAALATLEAKLGHSVHYREESGTSMAAPHVSGLIAAFLSIRQEFIGRSEHVKKIFLESATDLQRERYFQGWGLVDLMRAIQSI